MIEFFVPGIPQPGGSKRAFVNKKTGRAIITEDNPKSRPWRAVVVDRATAAMRGRAPLTGPVWMSVIFYVLRPRGHYGTGRNQGTVKRSAPKAPMVRPDYLKLTRSTEDALKGICWKDDSQVVEAHLYKRYGERPGADVKVTLWPTN